LKQVIYREGELEALQHRLLDLALWKVCQEFYMIINAVSLPALHHRSI
jgi:hypothetical protein